MDSIVSPWEGVDGWLLGIRKPWWLPWNLALLSYTRPLEGEGGRMVEVLTHCECEIG